MDDQELNVLNFAIIKLYTDKLSLEELAALNNVVSANFDPHDRLFDYEIVKPLFDSNGHCHDLTKLGIAQNFMERFKNNG